MSAVRQMRCLRPRGSFRSVRRERSRVQDVLERYGDYALAAALSAFVLSDVWANDYTMGSKPLLTATSLAMTVPLAWRRRAPFAVALTVAAALLIQSAIAPTPQPPDAPFLAWIITSYSVAAHADLRRALVGGALLAVAADLWAYRTGDDLVFVPVILAGFWIVGRVVRSRSVLAAQLAERTRELELEREERARLAVS